MYISDNLLFLELQKTGCSHIGRLLADILPGQQHGKHNRFPYGVVDPAKYYLGSVRNPWDWYLSLWAFGCDGRGAVFLHATLPQLQYCSVSPTVSGYFAQMIQHQNYSRHAPLWMENYSDVHNPRHFRQWLHMLHDPQFSADTGEPFGDSALSATTGLLTYRYISLFWRDAPPDGLDISAIRETDAEQCYIHHFIRNERLEEDFIAAMDACGQALTEDQRQGVYQRERTNASTQRDNNVPYYDADTIELVAQRDRLIIEKFGYQPPNA